MSVQLCLAELLAAARWAQEHAELHHAGEDLHPVFSLRNLEHGRVVTPAAITCESCDRDKVEAKNSKDVTCYEDA